MSKRTATCPYCGRNLTLTNGGLFRSHRLDPARGGRGPYCEGSGLKAEDKPGAADVVDAITAAEDLMEPDEHGCLSVQDWIAGALACFRIRHLAPWRRLIARDALDRAQTYSRAVDTLNA